jgi:hypothetical protein
MPRQLTTRYRRRVLGKLPMLKYMPASDLGVGKMQTAGSHWSEIVRVPSPLLGVTESPA